MKRSRQPSHPGAILKDLYLEPLNISLTEFAERIAVSRSTISAIVNEHQALTPAMAVRLSLAFSPTTPAMWLNLQQNYDLFNAEQKITTTSMRITPFPLTA